MIATQADEATRERQQYLTFNVAGDAYAVPILRVREIIEHGVVTKVPTTPPFIRGVMNLRGQVVPVVDLAIKFGMAETPVTRYTCDVVMEASIGDGDHVVMGVMAETVDQVIDLAPDEIEPPPEFGTPVRMEFLKALGRIGSRFVLILDIDRVMSSQEITAVASLSKEAAAGADAGAAEAAATEQ